MMLVFAAFTLLSYASCRSVGRSVNLRPLLAVDDDDQDRKPKRAAVMKKLRENVLIL